MAELGRQVRMVGSGVNFCTVRHSMPYMWTGRVTTILDQFSSDFGLLSKRRRGLNFGLQCSRSVKWGTRDPPRMGECFKNQRRVFQYNGKTRSWQKRGGIGIFYCSAQEENVEVDGSKESNCLYLRKTVRRGEMVEYSGSVVVCGDVEAGGHVFADGDVIVLGRLQGHVHAGKSGAAASKIFASVMEPREVRIADSALFSPKDDGTKENVAKVAVFLPGGDIRIQQAVNEKEQSIPRSEQRQRGVLSCSARDSPLKQISRDKTWSEGPARVALATGVYISVAGIALLGYPKILFGSGDKGGAMIIIWDPVVLTALFTGILFDLKGVAHGWVQVGAVLAVVFGVYYVGTAIGDMRGQNGARAFYFSTVVGRLFLFFSFLGLVLTGAVGGVNLLGALVMLSSLSKGWRQ